MTTIERINLDCRRQVGQFLELPKRIYAGIPQWVPPLAGDARRMLDPHRNPFFKHSEAAFFLATDSDGVSGRLAVLENRRYNEFNQEKTAFFYLFECLPQPENAAALFETAFAWASDRGLTRIAGPKGFSVLDGMGLLVKGFQLRPALGMPYNPDYYPGMLETAGFEPYQDVVSGYLSRDMNFPERVHEVARLAQERRGFRVEHFKTRSDLRKLAPHLQDLYNDALEGTSGNVPLTAQEAAIMAEQILWFADPKLIKIILKDEEFAGFLFAYPDISAALQRTGGSPLPFGWFHLLRELKKTEWVNINGAGILARHRGLGGTAILFSEMYKSITQGHYRHAEVVQVGVDNAKMQNELNSLGIDFYKTHRFYQKNL
jgi:hypothetical protein